MTLGDLVPNTRMVHCGFSHPVKVIKEGVASEGQAKRRRHESIKV